MKRRLLSLLTVGHIVTDINQGALPALLPFLMVSHNLSYSAAASLVFAANISSSIIQPMFGYFADKISAPWIMPMGLLLAGSGLAVTGLTSNYWAIFLAVAISGIGIAAFHPEGARLANIAAGDKKATGVSTFTAGGNVGFAVGPLIATMALTALGLNGTLLLLIPVIIVALLFISQIKTIKECQQNDSIKSVNKTQDLPDDEWNSFFRLTGVITCRSIVFFGLNTFLPLYWINVLKQTKASGSTSLTILLIMGAIGTLIAGRMADKYGHRNIIRIGFGALAPVLFIFVHTQDIKMATLMLIPVGFTLFTPFSPMVVLGQKYLPNHMGLASGVTLGLAVSIGGAFAPVLGVIADRYGVQTVLELLTIMPVLALLISFLLTVPKVDKPERSVISKNHYKGLDYQGKSI